MPQAQKTLYWQAVMIWRAGKEWMNQQNFTLTDVQTTQSEKSQQHNHS